MTAVLERPKGPDEILLDQLADRLGGRILTNGVVICPGPGRPDHDRSLMIWFDNRVEGRFALASTADDHDACHDHVAAILGVVLFDEAAAEARAASRRYWAPGGEADRKYPQQPMPYWPPTPPAAADEDLAGRRRRRLR